MQAVTGRIVGTGRLRLLVIGPVSACWNEAFRTMSKQGVHPDTIRNTLIIILGLVFLVFLVLWFDGMRADTEKEAEADPFNPARPQRLIDR